MQKTHLIQMCVYDFKVTVVMIIFLCFSFQVEDIICVQGAPESEKSYKTVLHQLNSTTVAECQQEQNEIHSNTLLSDTRAETAVHEAFRPQLTRGTVCLVLTCTKTPTASNWPLMYPAAVSCVL